MLLSVMTKIQAQDTAKIKTSAMCESCKNRLESRLGKLAGISSVHLDIASKMLTVIYDPKDLNQEKLEEKITEIGYDANTKIAKKSAYKRLPACCRKDYQGTH